MEEGESCPEPTEEEEREEDRGSGNISQDSPEEENPVMNFFKTLVTPTKTSKKEAPASDASKDQVAQVSDPPAAPKGMPAPPPPPPEPPRAEPAAKAAKPEEPKAAAKDSPKGKSSPRDTLTRLFRSKKPDASKASTLEAAAKPAPAPAAAPVEKKPEAKKSLLSFLKPKALLDTVSATVQAASTSGVQLLRKTTAAAAEPKAAPAPASAAAEPGPAKEDVPKAVKAEATAEAKPAAAPSGGEEPIPPKKLEKRNSITLFFKNLSQKRPSTDAGAPTEAAPAPSAEKTK